MIDYKRILKEYIRTVGEEEGVDFINRVSSLPEEELATLRAVGREVYEECRDLTIDAATRRAVWPD